MPSQHRRLPDGGWESDPWVTDERSLAVDVASVGLVVFSACSHAGIVNFVTQVRAGHCTGWRAVNALAQAFGLERMTPLAVGKRVTYSAA